MSGTTPDRASARPPDLNYAQLAAQYGLFWPWLVACIFRHDPMRLDFGHNRDEYEPEAADLLTRLPDLRDAAQVTSALRAVFTHGFDGLDLGDETIYARLGAEIWTAWGAR